MKILVTGGAGFIGSHIVDALLEEGYSVAVLDNLSSGKKKNLNKSAEFFKVDLKDESGIEKVFKEVRPEVVFHYGAQINARYSAKEPAKDAEVNILGSLKVIKNFLEKSRNPLHFFFASTGGVMYGDTQKLPTPETKEENPPPYGIAKLSVEKYLRYFRRTHGLDYTAFRLSNTYGPRQNPETGAGVIAIFSNQILSGEDPVVYGDGTQTRDYVYVKDVVKANMLALEERPVGIYNISTGKERSVNEIFDKLVEISEKTVEKKYRELKGEEQMRSCLDYSKAKKDFGWEPSWNFDEGLRKTFQWFKNKGN